MEANNIEYTHTYTGEQLGGEENKDTRNDVKSVNIDSSITTIKEDAFVFCSNLTYINIPESVTSIESYAFYYCSSLTSITIPSSVKTIGYQAFYGCESLVTVINMSPTTTIEPAAFDKCPLNDEFIQRIYKFYKKQPKLTDSFQEGKGATLGFLGSTQKGHGPEMWGITLDQIKYICNNPKVHWETTMRDVVEIVIKPATKGLGIGYSLLVNQDKPLRAKVMVSVSTLHLTMHLQSIVSFYHFQQGHFLTLSIFYCLFYVFITY